MLTNVQCKNAKPKAKPYKLTDSHGLYLEVVPSGTKTWRYRYRLKVEGTPRERVYTLGRYLAAPQVESDFEAQERYLGGTLTLMEARQERDVARGLVKRGICPVQHRQGQRIEREQETTDTLERIAREWVATRLWEDVTKAKRLDMLQRVVFPHIGSLPIRRVTPPNILGVLQKARENNGPSVAAEARRTLSGVYGHAMATLRATSDPVAPVSKALPPNKTQHKRALKKQEIGQLLREFGAKWERNHQTVAVFNFMWWTLCRPCEAVGASWVEIDLETAQWRIPSFRMKMRQEHLVTLPTQAVSMLRVMHSLTGHLAHVFPHRDRRDEGMTEATMRSVLHQIGWSSKFSPHATRTTGSTMLNESMYPT